MSPLLGGLIAIASIVANAFFVASEFALLAARRSRIEQFAADGRRGARSAQKALRELTLMLAGAQFGITAATIVLGAVAEPALAGVLEGWFEGLNVPEGLVHPVAFAIALAVVVFAHMVIGEMAPKSWAITDPERSAMLLARPFRAFTLAFRPFLVLLNNAANWLLRLLGVTPQDERSMQAGPAELAVLLVESVELGKIEADEADMIESAIRLSGLTASSAMVPRHVVDAVVGGADLDTIEERAFANRRSRVVVTNEMGAALGVVHIRDVLSLETSERRGRRADELMYSLLRLEADTALEDVLLAMQREHRHMAVVFEHEAWVGIVTMQDVLGRLITNRDSFDLRSGEGALDVAHGRPDTGPSAARP
ncbi:hemolysin family protein [soil metagenome]